MPCVAHTSWVWRWPSQLEAWRRHHLSLVCGGNMNDEETVRIISNSFDAGAGDLGSPRVLTIESVPVLT